MGIEITTENGIFNCPDTNRGYLSGSEAGTYCAKIGWGEVEEQLKAQELEKESEAYAVGWEWGFENSINEWIMENDPDFYDRG